MIFESMWPLALLLSVPVVIILYLLKPRGKDYRISSNLLWAQLFRNQQSKTFLEKFVTNILMMKEQQKKQNKIENPESVITRGEYRPW